MTYRTFKTFFSGCLSVTFTWRRQSTFIFYSFRGMRFSLLYSLLAIATPLTTLVFTSITIHFRNACCKNLKMWALYSNTTLSFGNLVQYLTLYNLNGSNAIFFLTLSHNIYYLKSNVTHGLAWLHPGRIEAKSPVPTILSGP